MIRRPRTFTWHLYWTWKLNQMTKMHCYRKTTVGDIWRALIWFTQPNNSYLSIKKMFDLMPTSIYRSNRSIYGPIPSCVHTNASTWHLYRFLSKDGGGRGDGRGHPIKRFKTNIVIERQLWNASKSRSWLRASTHIKELDPGIHNHNPLHITPLEQHWHGENNSFSVE